VLFWCSSFLPYLGGVEVLGSRLLLALRDRHELVVVTGRDSLELPEDDELGGVPIKRLAFRRALESRDPATILETQRRVARLKRDFRPHLTNVYHPGPDIFFHVATRAAAPSPELAVLHMGLPPELLRPGSPLRRWLEASAWVAACSASVLAETRREVPAIASRASVLYGSLPPPPVAPQAPGLDAPRLVCVGRVTEPKGFDVALVAFRAVLDRFPEARLAIAGDGPFRPELERLAAALGVSARVDFLGWVSLDRTFELIGESTLVVMPSREEPFGLVAVQAAQMARPIVASRVGGLPEIVVHGETGLLVPPGDGGALAESITALLEAPALAARLGRAAHERVGRRFVWERFVEDYDRLCRRLAGNGGAPHGDGA
jgi:glycogen(starch) synthase